MVSLHLHRSFRPQRDFSITLFLLSPCNVDDIRGERRRPSPDDHLSINRARRRRRRARTRPGEHDSHDLPNAHHSEPFALPSSPQTTPRSLPEVDARSNTWPQFRRHREHFALLGPQLPTYPVPHTTTPPTNVSVRDGDMRRAISSSELPCSLTPAHFP
ncbi:hypothetical protein EV121DRAFT_298149 [Schizophyllum commune]